MSNAGKQICRLRARPKAKHREEAEFRTGRPHKPAMTAEAETFWDEFVSILRQRQLLTRGDGPMLLLASEAAARYQRCTKILAAQGEMITITVLDSHGQHVEKQIPNPLLKTVTALESSLRGTLRALGLDVIGRDRAVPVKPPKPRLPKPAADEMIHIEPLEEEVTGNVE